MAAQPPPKKLLSLVRKAGVLRTRELESHGISRVYLKRLVDSGQLERIGRGLYTLADADLGEAANTTQRTRRTAELLKRRAFPLAD